MTNQKINPSLQNSNIDCQFISAYSPKKKVSITFPEEGMTKQSFKAECDINNILARYQKTGILEYVQEKQPQYADVTGLDYQNALNIVIEAEQLFNEIPANIRKKFGNDPTEFLGWIQNPANEQEAIEAGFLTKKSLDATPTPPTDKKPDVPPL